MIRRLGTRNVVALLLGGVLVSATIVAADTTTSIGDRSGEGATAFSGLAGSPEANLFTGALTTDIQIKVPPGRKGMTPRLALRYASTGSASPFGYGWDLTMGRIDRSTKWGVPRCTGAHTDEFVLLLPDGNAVDLVPSAAGGFRPDIEESYIKADRDSVANTWTVRDRAGMRYTFGDHASARVSTKIDGPVLALNPDGSCDLTAAWMLTRVEDTNGNSIDIEWTSTENVPLPSRILYGGNSNGIPHIFTVVFHYLWRPPADMFTSYKLGVEQRTMFRLTGIAVYSDVPADQTFVRGYGFHYFDEGSSNSLLNSVTASDEPTQTFVYSELGLGHTNESQAASVSVPAGYTYLRSWNDSLEVQQSIIDMNGDGKLDLVKGGFFPWNVHFGRNDGAGSMSFDPTPVLWTGDNGYSEGRIRNVWIDSDPCDDNGWACTVVDTFDITGDGRTDYVVATDPGQPWRVHAGERHPDGSWGFSETPILWPAPDRMLRQQNGGHTYRDTIDVNGDGLPDFVDVVGGVWSVWLNNGLGFESTPLPSFPSPVASISHSVSGDDGPTLHMLADMNGDGLADLLRHVDAGGDPLCDDFPWDPGLAQEINRHDCLLLYYNTGQGFSIDPEVMPLPLSANGVSMQQAGAVIADLVDVNGDGLPDWVELSSDGLSWNIMTNVGGRLTGLGFASTPPYDAVTYANWPGGSGPIRRRIGRNTAIDMVDLNGDGFLDRVVSGGTAWEVQLNGLSQKPKLMTMMENGLGGTNTIVYEPSSRFDHSGGDEQPDLPFITWVVGATRLNDGLCTPPPTANVFDRTENPCIDLGHERLDFFDYQDGRLAIDYEFDSGGAPIGIVHRGFRGFRRVTRTDIDGNETASVFAQGPEARGRLLELYYYAGDQQNGSLVRYETNQWSTRPTSGGGRTQIWLSQNARLTYDLGATPHAIVTRNDEVDPYGNVLRTSVLGSSTPTVETLTFYAFPFGANGCYPFDRPQYVLTTSEGVTLEERRFHYDGAPLGTLAAANLTRIEMWLDTESTWVATENEYDEYGNIVRARNGNGAETFFDYDDGTGSYLYPISEINPVGHQLVTAVDYRYGRPAIRWGANGISTATVYQYDAAGRLICEARPGDSLGDCTFRTTYDFADSTGEYSSVRVERKQSGYSVGRVTTAFFDALGRERFSEVDAVVQGNPSLVRRGQVDYDAGGRVRERYYPYPAADVVPSKGSTRFDYHLNGSTYADPLGRVYEINHSDGTSTREEYFGELVRSYDEQGYRTDRFLDAHHRVVREERLLAGSIESSMSTEYDGMGRVTAIYQNDSVIPSKVHVFDSMGRRVSVVDRDSGTWTYGYDHAGNLLYRDDPKPNQHVQYCYDAADRPLRSCPMDEDFQTAYPCAITCESENRFVYDDTQVPFSIGRLSEAKDDAGAFRVLEYDARGRQVVTEREIDAGGEVTRARLEFAYNDTDEIISVRYPDGEVVTTTYDEIGQPISLQNDSGEQYVTSVWYDELRRATSVWHGNGTRDTRSYFGEEGRHRLQAVTTTAQQSFALMMVFDYDARGQISSVGDFDGTAKSNNASYQYDHLGRLTSYDSHAAGAEDRTYQYDSWGNMVRKGDRTLVFGDPSLPNVSPHQVLATNGIFVVHDENGNRLSGAVSGTVYSFNAEDRLERVVEPGASVEFLYDYEGKRRARIVDQGQGDQITRYYDDLVHTTADGKTVKSYFLGGVRVATGTSNDTSWQMAAADGGVVRVVSAWQGRPVLLVEFDPMLQNVALAGTLLLLLMVALAPRGRSRRVVGVRVRRAHASALAIVFVFTVLPWPVLVRPASAQCSAPTPTPTPPADISHLHQDHLGSTMAITDGDGIVREHLRYMPFGELRGRWDRFGTAISSPSSETVRFEYTGHETEAVSGLIYAGARFYDPVIGSFLSPDPVGEFSNPYSYVGWDPINGEDPTGECEILCTLAVSFVVGFAIAAGDAAFSGDSLGESLKAGLIGGLTSAFTSGILGPAGSAIDGVDGWVRVAGEVVKWTSAAYQVYSTVESFRQGEYLAGSRGALLILNAAYGGFSTSGSGVGAKPSSMPSGAMAFDSTAPGVGGGPRLSTLADRFPAQPPSGTAANIRSTSVTVFGIKVEVGTAWAIDSAGGRQVFDIFSVGFESEILEIGTVAGAQLTDASDVGRLGGRSTSLGGSGGPSVIGFGGEYTVGQNYSGVTVYAGAQFGIAPIGAYALRENWTPRSD